MSAQQTPLPTVEDYLAFDRTSDGKYEFYRGQITAMAGGSPNHSQIIAAVTALLWLALRQRPCRVFTTDARLAADSESHYTYPDVMVVCGELRFIDPRRDTMNNPALIVEVLSASTERADHGRKFADYRKLESLSEYLLLSQFEPRAELYRRQPDGSWSLIEWTGLDAIVTLESIQTQLRLAEVYEKVAFEPEAG